MATAKKSTAKKPTAKKPAAKKPAKKPAAKKPGAAGALPPGVTFPGQLEVAAEAGAVIVDLPLARPLPVEARVALRLTAREVRPHLYVVLRSADLRVTVLAEAGTAAFPAPTGGRLPQPGAWLVCPRDGVVIVIASRKPLDRAQIVKAAGGRNPPPGKGTDPVTVD